MARTKTRRRAHNRGAIAKAVNGGATAMTLTAATVQRPFGLLEALNAATNHGMPPGDYRPMPRDPNDLGAFGPGQPIQPEPIDPLNPRTGRPEPRSWEYPQSWNLPGNNRREVPWQVLRAAAAGVDIIRRCIEVRKAHVADLQWSWSVRASVVEKAYNSSRDKGYDAVAAELREKHQADIERLTARWEQPWPHQDWSFDQWIRSMMEELLVIDAGVVYPRMSLGGDILGLEQVDGSTIKPLLDHRGNRPISPFPAFQQETWGFPRGEWAASYTLDADGNEVIDNAYAASELYYFRANPRVTSPYGLSPVEQALISARLYLKRQGWMLAEYEDGSTPLTWIETPESPGTEMKPQDRRIWEESVNAEYSGNSAARHRMKVGAPGWKITQLQSADERYKPDFDLYLVKLVAGHFGVTATELGFSETTGLGGVGWQEGQAEVGGRVGLRPDVKALTGLINGVSRQFLNAPPEIEFSFIDPASENDKDSDSVADAQLKRAVITINDDRRRLKLPLFSFPEADMPMLVGVGTSGYVFVEGAKAAADAAAEAAVKAQEATAEGATGKLEIEQAKIDDGKEARHEEQDLARETRDAEHEFQREQAATTTKAVTSELAAFATWRKRNPEPKRPFVFKAACPDDFAEPPGPDVADFGDEWMWLTDDMIEKRAKSGLDWKAWNALHPNKPKGPNGRWVKVGTVLGDALDAASKVEPFGGIGPDSAAVPRTLGEFRTMAAEFNAEAFNVHEFGETWTAAIKGGDDDGPLRWATRDQSGQWTNHQGARIADQDVMAHLEEMYANRAELRDKRNAYFRSKRPGGPKPKPEYSIARRHDRFTVMGPGGELHEASTRREADAWLKQEKARRSLTKAAAPEAGGADPKAPDERWPGWEQDLAIAAAAAAAMMAALTAGVASSAAVAALAAAFRDWAPPGTPISEESVAGWLRATTTLGPDIEQTIRPVIEDMWAEAYMVGTRSAAAVVDNLAEGIAPREAISVEVDWQGWTPGDSSAARRIMAEDGSIEPFRQLLRDAGITIKRIADNRLHEVAKCLAEGLQRGASVDEIARDLQRTVADPKWCYKVALTETNRALSAATLETYEQAGLGASEWMTALDQRVCKRCAANENAGPVRLGERYPSSDYHPPAHPLCRCALVPSMLDDLLKAAGMNWRAYNAAHPTGQQKDSRGRWERGSGASLSSPVNEMVLTDNSRQHRIVDMCAMYVYYEGCGYESEPFEAASDEAAEAHVMTAFRSPDDPDFDGDEGGIIRLDRDEDGEEVRERVAIFEGINMIPDPFDQRGSHDGLTPGRAWQ